MIELEATLPTRIPSLGYIGAPYDHAADYRPAHAQAAVSAVVGVPVVQHLDAHRRATRSPLFKAALGLLAGHDRMALLLVLSDAYPRESFRALDQALREMATMFAAAGLFPKAGT